MTVALFWPIVLPFMTAVAALFARSRSRLQFGLSLAGAALHAALTLLLLGGVIRHGIAVEQMGGWPAPFGVTLVADGLSAMMVAISGFVGVCVVVYSRFDVTSSFFKRGYHTFLHILIGGICGAFLAGDLFNLYVWFEVMLMASFALMVMGRRRAQLDGGVKYVTINLVATLMFLSGIGLLYGMTGTLNLADLHIKVQTVENRGLLLTVSMFFLIAFGIKAALFPLFFWLPASYHTPPPAVSAIFSGLLTKVGVYALIRLYTLVFTVQVDVTHRLLLILAVLTMITGVLGAAAHTEIRRILSFHIISQVGYMVLGLGLFTPLALAGSVFYLLHHIIVKANLFLVSGLVWRTAGSFELERIGGLFRFKTWLALLFFVPAFSLAGFPPLSGFWAKMVLIRASLEVNDYVVAILAAAVGLMTAFSMTKIWDKAFWKPAPQTPAGGGAVSKWMIVPVAVMAVVTVVIGLLAGPFMEFSMEVARQLMEPGEYVRAVLGGTR